MGKKKKTDKINDLMAAKEEVKEEVKEKIRMLTDEELEQVVGGDGDKRDMNEALADIDGLTEAEDGFC